MKLLYATTNEFKIQNMIDRLSDTNIEIITPKDLNDLIEIEENGTTVVENAILKATAYYNKYKMPTIAGDSALFVDKFTHQPGLCVRRIQGEYLEDDKLEDYYIKKLEEIGRVSNAHYVTGGAIIIEDKLYTIEIAEDEFILTADISTHPRGYDPLGRLEYDPILNKYFCELTQEDKKKRNYNSDTEWLKFIKKTLKSVEEKKDQIYD